MRAYRLLSIVIFATLGLHANVRLPALISDHMMVQRDLPVKTLARYLARFRKQLAGSGEQSTSQRLVAVEVTGPCSVGELTVLLSGGLRIEVKRGFDI